MLKDGKYFNPLMADEIQVTVCYLSFNFGIIA
jgi:hypothetical protein